MCDERQVIDIVGTEGPQHRSAQNWYAIGDERGIGTDILLVYAEQRPGAPTEAA